jgi:hypothetical protein
VGRVIAVARLALRLVRLGGPRAALSAGLVGVGVAVATALLAFALGGLHGWDAREARTGWRAEPETGGPGAAAPALLVASRTEHAAGRPIAVVELAVTDPAAGPPPGLPRAPEPGELWVSPALADLLAALPADRLADRFPAPPTGTVADAGLRGPDELLAIVGRAPGDPALADATGLAGWAAPEGAFGLIEVYRQLTVVAVALLVFPVAGLVGASARLTAARRTRRLALLRLLGASTRQVVVAATTEVTAVAAVAAVAGVALHRLAAPLVALLELGGGRWFAADVRPPPAVLVGIVAGVALLALASSVGGLRRVVVGPLGVARRDRPSGAGLVRVLGVVAALGVFGLVNAALQGGGTEAGATGLVFGVGVLALFGAVSLIGPLVVRLLGRRMVRSARGPAVLLAGRRLLDDPKGAFRPVAGVVLAVFVAGFLAPLTAAAAGAAIGDDRALLVPAPAAEVQQRLAAAGLAAQVEAGEGDGDDALRVVPLDDRDRVRTALAPLVPGTAVATERETDSEAVVLVADLRTGVLVVLAGTFVLAAAATGTAAAARVLDHRRTLRLLRLTGTPLAVLDAARRAETLRPLAVCGGIALAAGLLAASPFAAAADALAPSGLLLLGAVVLAGALLVAAATAASRPLLRAVTTDPARED